MINIIPDYIFGIIFFVPPYLLQLGANVGSYLVDGAVFAVQSTRHRPTHLQRAMNSE